MKKTFALLIFAVIATLVSITACQDDISLNSEDMIDTRDNFVGDWRCVEDESGISYTVSISKDPENDDNLVLKNFHGLGEELAITASVGYGVVTLIKATLDGYTLEGDGLVESNYKSIAWEYTVDDGNGPIEISSLFTPAGVEVKQKTDEKTNAVL